MRILWHKSPFFVGPIQVELLHDATKRHSVVRVGLQEEVVRKDSLFETEAEVWAFIAQQARKRAEEALKQFHHEMSIVTRIEGFKDPY